MDRTGVINVKSNNALSGIYIIYRGSTANEKHGNYGISHLMEHLMCDGVKHLEKDFQQHGINHNAYTSDMEIVFYITGLDEHVLKFRDEYIKSITEHVITEERFNDERKVVIQEYNNRSNNQMYVHQSNLFRKLYDNFGPIGKLEDLEALTMDDVNEYRQHQYAKPTQIIYVSQDHELPEDLMEFDNRTYKDTITRKEGHEVIIEGDNKSDQSSVSYMSDVVKDDFAVAGLICFMLGSGMTSPLMDELREKRGLVYGFWCYMDYIDENSAVINIAAEMVHNNVDEFMSTLDMVLDNKVKYLTQERLDIIKQYVKIKEEKIDINRHAQSFVSGIIDPEVFDVAAIVGTIGLERVHEVYDKYFTNWYKSVDTKEFIKEEA